MSDVNVDNLNQTINELNQKLADLTREKDQLLGNEKGLCAQLDASKQMFNEGFNTIFLLRTQINMGNQVMKDQANKLSEINKAHDTLRSENLTLMTTVSKLNKELEDIKSQFPDLVRVQAA